MYLKEHHFVRNADGDAAKPLWILAYNFEKLFSAGLRDLPALKVRVNHVHNGIQNLCAIIETHQLYMKLFSENKCYKGKDLKWNYTSSENHKPKIRTNVFFHIQRKLANPSMFPCFVLLRDHLEKHPLAFLAKEHRPFVVNTGWAHVTGWQPRRAVGKMGTKVILPLKCFAVLYVNGFWFWLKGM